MLEVIYWLNTVIEILIKYIVNWNFNPEKRKRCTLYTDYWRMPIVNFQQMRIENEKKNRMKKKYKSCFVDPVRYSCSFLWMRLS